MYFNGLRQVDYRPSPGYGEHNEKILGETLNIDAETRALLAAEGVI